MTRAPRDPSAILYPGDQPARPSQPDPRVGMEGLFELIDTARARRREAQPLDARWYPEDRPGTQYLNADDKPQPERPER